MKPEYYCAALETWAKLARKENIISDQVYLDVRKAIVKSNLLDRLIYGQEKLRTRKCPLHKGKWSGISFDKKCPGLCDSTNGNLTGWIPEEAVVAEEWGWTFWLSIALGQDIPTMSPARWYKKGTE